MGKASRRRRTAASERARRPSATSSATAAAAAGARQPYRAPIPFRERPFEGLAAEVELVAMREFIPCAVLPVRTTAEHGGVDLDIVTLLPDGHPAMVRPDGRILVGLQTRFHSGDLSHDAGGALLAAIAQAGEGADGLVSVDVREPAPRLQDLLDPEVAPQLEIREDFGYWFDPDAEPTAETERALAQNRDDVIPTEEVPGVHGMYWCQMNRTYVRYVTPFAESALFTALARLQAGGQARIGEGSRFVGAFRACGLVIPVFELEQGASPSDVAGDARVLADALERALENTDRLTPDERRARDGLVSRQVTIR